MVLSPKDVRERGGVFTYMFAASAIIGVLAVTGFEILPQAFKEDAEIRIEPKLRTVLIGETFTLEIIVDSSIPVNVFAGELSFNEKVMHILSIDYNTSIADLWAEKPWYENGAGTLNFGGGTTKKGGFVGTGSLIKVNMVGVGAGNGTVVMHNARIIKHDGLGTDVAIREPIDAIIKVTENMMPRTSVAHIDVRETSPSADLNGDGTVNFTDASILMLHLLSENPRYDLNEDGNVDATDLKILLRN